jgi:uncharacterized coiled-coil protein SlyX
MSDERVNQMALDTNRIVAIAQLLQRMSDQLDLVEAKLRQIEEKLAPKDASAKPR